MAMAIMKFAWFLITVLVCVAIAFSVAH